jgi:hypothetical protein
MHIKNNNKKLPPVLKKPPPVQKKPPPVQKKPEPEPEPEADENKGPLDENGNPFPIENPEGGDPICPGGYKINNQFDIFDPINPLFRCITSLKEDGDGGGMAKKMLAMANEPSSGITNVITTNKLPIGGKRGRKPTRGTKIRRSVRHCCRTRRRCRRSK